MQFGAFASRVGSTMFGASKGFLGFAAAQSGKVFGGLLDGVKKAGIGAGLALGGLALAGKSWLERADAIKKSSDRLGSTAEDISAIAYAAEQSGASLEDVEAGVKGLFKALASDEGVDALRQLGIFADDLKKLPLTEQLARIAEALSGVKNGSDRGALALKIFGKNGLSLLPLMKDGAEGIRDLVKEADRVGAVVTSSDAAAAERIGDTISRAWTAAKYAVLSVGAAILGEEGTVNSIADTVIDVAAKVKAWVAENRQLVIVAAGVAAAVAAAGAALFAVGPILAGLMVPAQLLAAGLALIPAGLAAAAGVAATVLGAVGTAAGAAVGIVVSGLKTVLALGAGLARGGFALLRGAGPLGIAASILGAFALSESGAFDAVGAVAQSAGRAAGAAADLVTTAFGAIGSAAVGMGKAIAGAFFDALGAAKRVFADMVDAGQKAFEGIGAAVKVGDFGKAGEIALAALDVVWERIQVEAGRVWRTLRDQIADELGKAFDVVKAKWDVFADAVIDTLRQVKQLIGDVKGFGSGLLDSLDPFGAVGTPEAKARVAREDAEGAAAFKKFAENPFGLFGADGGAAPPGEGGGPGRNAILDVVNRVFQPAGFSSNFGPLFAQAEKDAAAAARRAAEDARIEAKKAELDRLKNDAVGAAIAQEVANALAPLPSAEERAAQMSQPGALSGLVRGLFAGPFDLALGVGEKLGEKQLKGVLEIAANTAEANDQLKAIADGFKFA